MKRLLIAVAMLACLGFPVKAQQPGSAEALRAADELVRVLGPDMIKQMSDGMVAQMWGQMQARLAGKVDPATIAELRAEFEKSLARFVTESMQDAPALYAKYLSAQELRDIAAFYRTPAGAKSLQVMPKIMPEFMNVMMPRMPKFQQELAANIQAIMTRRGYKD